MDLVVLVTGHEELYEVHKQIDDIKIVIEGSGDDITEVITL